MNETLRKRIQLNLYYVEVARQDKARIQIISDKDIKDKIYLNFPVNDPWMITMGLPSNRFKKKWTVNFSQFLKIYDDAADSKVKDRSFETIREAVDYAEDIYLNWLKHKVKVYESIKR